MNIATLIRWHKGSYQTVWAGNSWSPHSNLIELARHYGAGMTVIAAAPDVEKICEACDGLIIPGSPHNIDPTYYGGEPFDPPNEMDEYALDRQVIAAFDKMNKPMLGICGGIQALNVYFGGTLGKIADMRQPVSENHNIMGRRNNRYGVEIDYSTHEVNIEKDSFLYDVYGKERIAVNSYHQWAVKRLADGFKVVSTSDDGIVEAIEWKERKIFGTQFHPELGYYMNNPNEMKLFENFFRACGENAK